MIQNKNIEAWSCFHENIDILNSVRLTQSHGVTKNN